MGMILAALLERLDGPEGARRQGDYLPRAAFIYLQRRVAYRAPLGLGDKLDTGDVPRFARDPCHFRRRPARLPGVPAQPTQDFELPPFLPMDSRSYRAKTASTCAMEIGGECPRR